MKIENYYRMDKKHSELCEAITNLNLKLKKPLTEIEAIEEQLALLYSEERILREKSEIVGGIRTMNEVNSTELQGCEKQINKHLRQQKVIERKHKDDFKRLKVCLKEERRIRDKDKVYRIYTELDQIMTCFKMTFINLCSLFLTKCMGNEKYELLTLFESIFQLEGTAFVDSKKKVIELEMNPKEPELMRKLNNGLCVLNKMDVHDIEGRTVQFKVRMD